MTCPLVISLGWLIVVPIVYVFGIVVSGSINFWLVRKIGIHACCIIILPGWQLALAATCNHMDFHTLLSKCIWFGLHVPITFKPMHVTKRFFFMFHYTVIIIIGLPRSCKTNPQSMNVIITTCYCKWKSETPQLVGARWQWSEHSGSPSHLFSISLPRTLYT